MASGAITILSAGECGPDVRACPHSVQGAVGPDKCCGAPARRYTCEGSIYAPICVDTCPDASPIIGRTPVEGLYFNCGWGTGGFKATPGSGWVMAYTIAHDQPHPLNAPFSLERFTHGYLIDEHGAAGVAH